MLSLPACLISLWRRLSASSRLPFDADPIRESTGEEAEREREAEELVRRGGVAGAIGGGTTRS